VRDPSAFQPSIQLNDRINPFSRSDSSIYPPKTMAGIGGDLHAFASRHGLSVNEQGRVYESGKALPLDLKVQIGYVVLDSLLDESESSETGIKPKSITALANECKVSRATIRKIRSELLDYGRVLSPEEIAAEKGVDRGVGTRCLSSIDIFTIFMTYLQDPSTTLRNYVKILYLQTGTVVSKSTISRFFNHGFEIRGSLCKPNMIPFDKFRPENYEKALIYMTIISKIDPRRIKFGDEKHLEGSELYCRKVRKNVFTGEVPGIMAHPDFRNVYSIVGFCSIDTRVSPVRFGITQNLNDSSSFSMQVVLAVQSGFLQHGDVLVLDNAAIHTGGVNTDLEEWLWANFRIFLLYLPPRVPEWNPIELVWNILVSRLQVFSLEYARLIPGAHSLVAAACHILSEISHHEVMGCYKKSGYMGQYV
jgi:transposase